MRNSNPFQGIDTWIFDLDNTLYPADCHLFRQIDQRMSVFIQERLEVEAGHARFLQKDWYARHGTTLAGLMAEHDVAPQDFLEYVHDIDLSDVGQNAELREAISRLPGRRLIFTNGSVRHAENVAGKIGILDLFDGVFDIEAGDYQPKPHAPAYDRFIGHFDVTPERSAFFEDMPQNLQVPYEAGMRTVLVQSAAEWFDDEPEDKRPSKPGETYPHVHHVTDDLTGFLGNLTTRALADTEEDT
ncbi:pyrimidine 5'-nucleotidase [Parvularcula marina]|uniref:pyrimidine 5'-nucleotidase n=1 Tax=Parvularcula marina TaxID=2292771 RepID=UPI003513C440